MNKSTNIYVAGHRGMVGSAIVRQLKVLDCHVANLKFLPKNSEFPL